MPRRRTQQDADADGDGVEKASTSNNAKANKVKSSSRRGKRTKSKRKANDNDRDGGGGRPANNDDDDDGDARDRDAHLFVAQPDLVQLRVKIPDDAKAAPGCCARSANFWVHILGCIVVPCCVVLPLFLGLAAAADSRFVRFGFVFGAIVFPSLACLYLLFSCRHVCMMKPSEEPPPRYDSVWDAKENKQAPNGARAPDVVNVRQVVLIVNPFGGGGKALQNVKKIAIPIFEKANVKVKLVETEHAGHAVELAATMSLDGVDVLCIAGGDGSVHELVNGALSRQDRQRIPLGFLPAGTGNSLQRDMFNDSMAEATRRIIEGTVRYMDSNLTQFKARGKSVEVYSVNLAAVGMIGDSGALAEKVRFLGKRRYDATAIWLLMKNSPTPFEIEGWTTDDFSAEKAIKIDGAYAGVSINASQYFGEGLRACPEAKLDDGKFDFLGVKADSRVPLILAFAWLPKGKHVNHRAMAFHQLTRCHIRTADGSPGVINIDGEAYVYDGDLTIVLKAAAIPFMAPLSLKDAATP